MALLPFAKVHGLGNDFLLVDLRPGAPAAAVRPPPTDPDVVRALCDRHFGIGADGVLAILPGSTGDARMRTINADGTEAEMCGNGIRCVAKVLYEGAPALRRPVLRIETGAGVLGCMVEARDGRVEAVTVDMGRPRLLRGEIPVAGPAGERAISAPLRAGDASFAFTAVSMGNPHAVIFVDDEGSDLRALAVKHGPDIEVAPIFPSRTNVEFARVRAGSPLDIEVVVWERGVGITLACGTGACATAVAACLEGRARPGEEIAVHLPGGALGITVVAADEAPVPSFAGVRMRGPAQVVYEAQIDPTPLLARRGP